MAIYHCSVKVIGRSGGRSAIAAAAYRAGEKIKDVRNGRTHDYSRKQDVDHAEIIAPENAPEWASDRQRLWNEVERIEKRRDAQLAREIVVALPRELSQAENLGLAAAFAKSSFVDRGMVADLALHGASSGNPHAHIMLTMRETGPDGFGGKNRDWNRQDLVREWRSEWSEHANAALEMVGREERIDHRSLEAQGIEREPGVHLGPRVAAMERCGIETARGRQLREVRGRADDDGLAGDAPGVERKHKDLSRLVREVSNWLSGAEAKVRAGYDRWVERHSRERLERETRERLYWEQRATEKAALREVEAEKERQEAQRAEKERQEYQERIERWEREWQEERRREEHRRLAREQERERLEKRSQEYREREERRGITRHRSFGRRRR